MLLIRPCRADGPSPWSDYQENARLMGARILAALSGIYRGFHLGSILSCHSRDCAGADLFELIASEPQIALRSKPYIVDIPTRPHESRRRMVARIHQQMADFV